MATGFNLPNYASASTGGRTAFGKVPNPVATPPNIYEQTSQIYPNLGQQAAQISSNIGSSLSGSLSPETINAIRNEAASFGVSSGMPGSQFAGNRGLRNLGLNVEATQRQGLGDYLSFLKGTGSTMTDPGLAYNVADRNSVYASAPDPRMAADEQERRYNEHLRRASEASAYRGPGGGTVTPSVTTHIPAGPGIGGSTPHFSSYSNLPTYTSTGTGMYYGGNYVDAPSAGTATSPVNDNSQSGWYFDPTMGGYVNSLTGAISDSPGSSPWEGFSWERRNTPAEEFYPEDYM